MKLIAAISVVSVRRIPNRIGSIRAIWSLVRMDFDSVRAALTSVRSATSAPHSVPNGARPAISTSTIVTGRL